jgi:capsular exopolysaccharide synthesis family protein
LDLPVLAVVPKRIHVLPQTTEDGPDSEAYRILKTNVDFARQKIAASVLSVVSGGPSEGKSTTACNLATTYAAAGQQTLIIGGDLRRPTQHRLFDLDNRVGLSEYLKGEVALDAVIQVAHTPNLFVITSGGGTNSTVSLLNSDKMRELVDAVKGWFDVVLFDCPPILGVSDALIVSALVDGSIIVTQHRRFPRSMLVRVKAAIESAGTKPLGVVLNNVDIKHDRSYGYYTSYNQYTLSLDRRINRPKSCRFDLRLLARNRLVRPKTSADPITRQRVSATMFTSWRSGLLIVLTVLIASGAFAGEALLRPGDTIELKIGGVPAADITAVTGAYMIDGQGFVNMPNLGKVKIGGLTTGAAQGAIESGYRSHDIYTNPTIIITMQAQSRWVNVGGEVKAPIPQLISRSSPAIESQPVPEFGSSGHRPVSRADRIFPCGSYDAFGRKSECLRALYHPVHRDSLQRARAAVFLYPTRR